MTVRQMAATGHLGGPIPATPATQSPATVRGAVAFRELVLRPATVRAAAIFLGAVSFDHWQVWIFLALYVTGQVAIATYLVRVDPQLLAGRLKTDFQYENSRRHKLLRLTVGISVLGLFVLSGVCLRHRWGGVPAGVSLACDGLVVMGLLIVGAAFRANSFASAAVEITPGQQVVSRGPYSIVRHPMYTGVTLGILATGPALGSLIPLLPAVVFIGTIVIRLRAEERFLVENLPGYSEYCKQVRRRLVPALW